MTVDLTRVKSRYVVNYKNITNIEVVNGVTYTQYEEAIGTLDITQTIDLIAKLVTDNVEKIHFAKVELVGNKFGKRGQVNFTIRFLDDEWFSLDIPEINVNTDAKYGYSFLASALREKYPNIAVCAKKLEV